MRGRLFFASKVLMIAVFDTNACPSANGRKFGGRADIFWQISNKIGPDGQQYFGPGGRMPKKLVSTTVIGMGIL